MSKTKTRVYNVVIKIQETEHDISKALKLLSSLVLESNHIGPPRARYDMVLPSLVTLVAISLAIKFAFEIGFIYN